MKYCKKCVKCGTDNWRRKLIGFRNVYQCKKCGYVFDWLDYIEIGKIDASVITTKKLFVVNN